MNLDTPLTEVATFIPPATAKIMMKWDVAVQTSVLVNLRYAIYSWEMRGAHFDPIQFEAAIETMVIPLGTTMEATMGEVDRLRKQLDAAEILITSLATALTARKEAGQ